jgi:hypothetical protein
MLIQMQKQLPSSKNSFSFIDSFIIGFNSHIFEKTYKLNYTQTQTPTQPSPARESSIYWL